MHLTKQKRPGPTVKQKMMMALHQRIFVGAPADQRNAQERRLRQFKAALTVLAQQGIQPAFAVGLRDFTPIEFFHRKPNLPVNDLNRLFESLPMKGST